jgi:hypothetical protein
MTDLIFELWAGPGACLFILTGDKARQAARHERSWRLVAALRASDLAQAGIDVREVRTCADSRLTGGRGRGEGVSAGGGRQ